VSVAGGGVKVAVGSAGAISGVEEGLDGEAVDKMSGACIEGMETVDSEAIDTDAVGAGEGAQAESKIVNIMNRKPIKGFMARGWRWDVRSEFV